MSLRRRFTLMVVAMVCLVSAIYLVSAAFLNSPPAVAAAEVHVTPLGSHDGEFCSRDRALVFEDPNGLRILYDAGRTIAGADDPRLGNIDVVLVSHVHGIHCLPC